MSWFRTHWLFSALVVVAALTASILGCIGDYARPRSFADLNALNRPDCRLGVFAGTGPAKVARKMFPNAEIVTFEDMSEAGASLLAGRLEGFVAEEHILNIACRAYPLRFRILDEALERQPARVLVRAKNKKLLDAVNAFIADFKRTGVYDDMFVRWCLADKYVPMPKIPEPAGSNGVLRVGMSGLVEPSNFIDANGQLTGYDVEFALRLGRALDRTVTFVLDPFRKSADSLKEGRVDVMIDNWNDPPAKAGLTASDGYLDSDTKVLIAEAQPGLEERVDELMLEGTRFGVADRLIGDVRVRLFASGFFNTVSITLLAALLGFWIARLLGWIERCLPRALLPVVDAALAFIRWTPPLMLLLVFYGAVLVRTSPWLTAVVALGIWFAAFLEPVAANDPLVWLPVLRLRLPVLLQWTCVVGTISVFDLAMAVDLVCGRSARAAIPLLAVAGAYGLLAWLFDRGVAWYERRIRK